MFVSSLAFLSRDRFLNVTVTRGLKLSLVIKINNTVVTGRLFKTQIIIKVKKMSDRRLEVFSEVAKFLSFTKAAESLQMTQPAVTFQIRRLEERLNTKLFSRAHNRVSLTAEGEVVLECAHSIFEKYDEMESRVQQLKEPESEVA